MVPLYMRDHMEKHLKIQLSKKQVLIIIIAISSIVSVLILLLNSAVRRGQFGFGNPIPMVTFALHDGSFSILYPQNWVAMETPQGSHGDIEIVAAIVVSGQAHAGVEIARNSFPDGNLSQVIAWGESRAASCLEFSPFFPLETLDDNSAGYILEYSCTYSDLSFFEKGETKFRYQDFYVYSNNIGYALSFFAPDTQWSDLEEYFLAMEKSFYVP
jgi:hypothetical protein